MVGCRGRRTRQYGRSRGGDTRPTEALPWKGSRRSRSPLHTVQKRGRTCSPSGSARSTAAAPGGNPTKSSLAATVETPRVPDTAVPSPEVVVNADLKDLLDSVPSLWSSPGVYLGPPEVEATTLNTPTVAGVLPITTATATTTPQPLCRQPHQLHGYQPHQLRQQSHQHHWRHCPPHPPVTWAMRREERKVLQQAVKGCLQPATVQREQTPSQHVDQDPRLWFARAPSLEAEGFPADELRRFREEVLKDSGIEKRVAFYPDGLTTVTKLEWAVLPDGTKYALETIWRRPNRTYTFPPVQKTRL